MIYVCGDTHLDRDYRKLNSKNWPEGKKLTKKDYLIITGDFGLISYHSNKNKQEKYFKKWYNEKPWTTLFVDGNHENFDRLLSDEFSEVEMFGSKVKQISDSIFYLQRGHVYTIEEKTFFTFGGGESIDKNQRIEFISWWKQEMPTYKETDLGISNLKKCNNKVDYIITHTCSHEMFGELCSRFDLSYKQNAEKSLRDFFSWIERNIQFEKWFFGHYHDDYELEKHILLYDEKPRRIV